MLRTYPNGRLHRVRYNARREAVSSRDTFPVPGFYEPTLHDCLANRLPNANGSIVAAGHDKAAIRRDCD